VAGLQQVPKGCCSLVAQVVEGHVEHTQLKVA
jgi:hypothetical protein